MIKWLTMGVLPILAIIFMSAKANEVMTRDKGTYVVNTTTLAADVNGYLETTPLLIYIKGNKIDHIEALPNQEKLAMLDEQSQNISKTSASTWTWLRSQILILILKTS